MKDLVDLVPFDQISVDGETITSLSNGRTSSYSVTLTPKNSGQPAPSTTITFSTKFG